MRLKIMFRWLGNVERMSGERIVKKIYDPKSSGKRGKRTSVDFENTVLKILGEDYVKSMRTLR